MPSQRTIPKTPPADASLDRERLVAIGMDAIRRLSRFVWTDHNVHDPGITILELLAYALTDLGYRAALPIEDLLASGASPARFPDGATLLASGPVTARDYRKLLLDIDGVANAWVEPAPRDLFADLRAGELAATPPADRPSRPVPVRGLHRVKLALHEDVANPAEAIAEARRVLHRNRNLCEDFVEPITVLAAQPFVLCAEIELDAGADAVDVAAQLLAAVQEHLTPTIRRYTLDEILRRPRADGSARDVAEVYEGPPLRRGFIDDDELDAATPRRAVYLSDVISVVMDVPGVVQVRDLVLDAPVAGAAPRPLADRWRVPVAEDHRAVLDLDRSRLVFYRRGMPTQPARDPVKNRYADIRRARPMPREVSRALAAPLGRARDLGRYTSFQNDFPEVYGIGEAGLPSDATVARRAQALQLKAYLLLFDQVMANYCAQLAHFNDLMRPPEPDKAAATDPDARRRALRSYHWQRVDGLVDAGELYPKTGLADAIVDGPDDAPLHVDRRQRLLDHLLARLGERVREHDAALGALPGAPQGDADPLQLRRAVLERGPAIAAVRAQGFDRRGDAGPPDVPNVSGLERRIALLLGLDEPGARPLSDDDRDGAVVIEALLLRDGDFAGQLLPACIDPACDHCGGDDPYSYRVYVLLPAWTGRGADPEARRYIEGLIREETPAHVLPRVCWVDRDRMRLVEDARRAWLAGRDDPDEGPRRTRLAELIHALANARSVHPPSRLSTCAEGSAATVHFVLGTHRLESSDNG